jgi:IMP dehydrogenase
MRFLNGQKSDYELTYSDVFIVPADQSTIKSRMEVDTTTIDGLGTSTPVIVSNMNAVAGKRMAETTARRGAMTMLLQNMPLEKTIETVKYVKNCHPVFETPIVMKSTDKIHAALNLINKRAHGTVIITDEKEKPIGIFIESDAAKQDLYSPLSEVMSRDVISFDHNVNLRKMFDLLIESHIEVAPVTKNGKLLGVVTRKGILRSELHKPALDKNGKLMVGVAIGINEDITKRVKEFEKMGVDVVLLDTANGHQKRLLDAIKTARKASKSMKIMAGTVVTAAGTKAIIEAGADIVKVGIGAGATCITRMQTGVGRPQFSAVLECAQAAKEAGGFVMADGGIRHPRDVALALAAGASTTMFASWFAPTFESPADIKVDSDGNKYVEHYGMASNRAVLDRNKQDDEYTRARKAFFEEGSSQVKLNVRSDTPGVEDILDQIVSGLRSTCSYVDARNLKELGEKATIGIQSPAAYAEGKAVSSNW